MRGFAHAVSIVLLGLSLLYLDNKGDYELHEIAMLPEPAKAKGLRGFVFERNGRRTIAYWHTCGKGAASLVLGEDRSATVVSVSNLKYIETDLSKDAVAKVFSAAEWSE